MSDTPPERPAAERPSAAPPPPPTRTQAVGMTLLAVDYGRRRIGLAFKPAGQDWCLPRQVLPVADPAAAGAALGRIVRESRADGVVVGLPVNPDPTMAAEVRRFCRRTRRATPGVRWFFVDETLTTEAAESMIRDVPAKQQRPSDDLAAVLILETFIQGCR
jgi:putative transcription antitermination factor YqgF